MPRQASANAHQFDMAASAVNVSLGTFNSPMLALSASLARVMQMAPYQVIIAAPHQANASVRTTSLVVSVINAHLAIMPSLNVRHVLVT